MTAEDEGRLLAERLREANHLGAAPISNLVEFVETTLEIDVAVLDMPENLSGLTQRDPVSGRLIIAIATGTSPEHQRFTLAHELGHIQANAFSTHAADVHRRSDAERLANSFAGHFLAPIEGILGLPPAADAHELMADIVRRFRVSPEAAAIQLRSAHPDLPNEIIRELSQKSVMWYAAKFGWDTELADQVRAAQHQRPPQRLLARAMSAYEQGRLGVTTLARLKFKTEHETIDELQEVGLAFSQASFEEERPHDIDVNRDW